MSLQEQLGLPFSRRDLTPDQRVALVTWFFGSYCRHVKGPLAKQTIVFEPWMLDNIVRPLFGTVDRYGRRKYTTGLVGMPRKHMKSLLGSGIGLYALLIEAMWEPGAEIYAIAAKKDQAQKVFKPAKQMVQADPFLSAYCEVYKDVIYCPEHGSEFRVLASDAPSEHGSNPFMYLIDELHAHPNMDMYEAMKTGTAVREEPLGLILTTAGKQRKGPLWDLLHTKQGRREFRYWIGAPEGADETDPKVWRAANPASWVTQTYLRDQFEDPLIDMAGFEAFHLNRFPMTKGKGRFFSPAELARTKKRPAIDASQPAYMTIDGADKSDHFAITLTQKDEKGVVHGMSRIFDEPPADRGYYDLQLIEDVIVEIYNQYNVERVALDGNRIRMLAIRLQDVYDLPIEEFPQSNQMMCPASEALRTLVRENRLNIGGNELLLGHLFNAIELQREPFGTRIGRASDEEKIDGAITLAMAAFLWEMTPEADKPWASVW